MHFPKKVSWTQLAPQNPFTADTKKCNQISSIIFTQFHYRDNFHCRKKLVAISHLVIEFSWHFLSQFFRCFQINNFLFLLSSSTAQNFHFELLFFVTKLSHLFASFSENKKKSQNFSTHEEIFFSLHTFSFFFFSFTSFSLLFWKNFNYISVILIRFSFANRTKKTFFLSINLNEIKNSLKVGRFFSFQYFKQFFL